MSKYRIKYCFKTNKMYYIQNINFIETFLKNTAIKILLFQIDIYNL